MRHTIFFCLSAAIFLLDGFWLWAMKTPPGTVVDIVVVTAVNLVLFAVAWHFAGVIAARIEGEA